MEKNIRTIFSGSTEWDIASLANAKNVLINTSFDADTVINQRNFAGDWSALAVGDYGYDMWYKFSATQIAQIVEEGTYKKNTVHTLSVDGVVLGKITSPASGHWEIVVPNTVNYVDLYAGDFSREWQPETNTKEECMSRYKVAAWEVRGDYGVTGRYVRTIDALSNFRRTPVVASYNLLINTGFFDTGSPEVITSATGDVIVSTDFLSTTSFDVDSTLRLLYEIDVTLDSSDASKTDIVGV